MPSTHEHTEIREFVENDIDIIHKNKLIRPAEEFFLYKIIDEGVTGLIYGIGKDYIDNAILSCLLYYGAPFNMRKIVYIEAGDSFLCSMRDKLIAWYNTMRLGNWSLKKHDDYTVKYTYINGVVNSNEIKFVDYFSIYFELNKFIHNIDPHSVVIIKIKNKDKLNELRLIYTKLCKKLRDKGVVLILYQM